MENIKEVLILVLDKETGETKKVSTDVYIGNIQKYEIIENF